ncbi:MAG: hypothetical protein HY926_04120 [Elusimicrobia bacterium]|nr:hypothetical protein [Elusimicrobiota bacterium]
MIVGGITVYWFYEGWRKVWQPYRHYEKAACRVLEGSIDRLTDSEGREAFLPRFQIAVLADDRTAVGYDLWREGLTRARAEKLVASYPTGQDLVCWHPPGKPHEAVLSRKPNIYWILCGAFLLLPFTALMLFMTVFGVYIWPKRRDSHDC